MTKIGDAGMDVIMDCVVAMGNYDPKKEWTLWDIFVLLFFKSKGRAMTIPSKTTLEALIEKGYDYRDIAREVFGGDTSVARFMLDEYDLPYYPEVGGLDEDSIVECWYKLGSIAGIARALNIDKRYVRKVLDKHGVRPWAAS